MDTLDIDMQRAMKTLVSTQQTFEPICQSPQFYIVILIFRANKYSSLTSSQRSHFGGISVYCSCMTKGQVLWELLYIDVFPKNPALPPLPKTKMQY